MGHYLREERYLRENTTTQFQPQENPQETIVFLPITTPNFNRLKSYFIPLVQISSLDPVPHQFVEVLQDQQGKLVLPLTLTNTTIDQAPLGHLPPKIQRSLHWHIPQDAIQRSEQLERRALQNQQQTLLNDQAQHSRQVFGEFPSFGQIQSNLNDQNIGDLQKDRGFNQQIGHSKNSLKNTSTDHF